MGKLGLLLVPLTTSALLDMTSALVRVAVKGYHDQVISYRGQHLIGAGLQVQTFSPVSLLWGAWQCVGRQGARGAEGSTSGSAGSKKRTSLSF